MNSCVCKDYNNRVERLKDDHSRQGLNFVAGFLLCFFEESDVFEVELPLFCTILLVSFCFQALFDG